MDTSLVQYSTTGAVVGPIANLGDDPVRSLGVEGANNLGLGQLGSAREEGDVWKEITSRLWEDWMGGAWMKKSHSRGRS